MIFLTIGLNPKIVLSENGRYINIGIGDIPGIETVNIEAAAALTRERGISVNISYLQSENLAVQAVINGLADIGVGTPYKRIQRKDSLLRMFYQLNTLSFFPVVNTDYYRSWKDLDGAEVYTHGRGSGTEAIMNLMAKQHSIRYGAVLYLPGSGVRARGMLHGRIKATIVDMARRNQLLGEGNRKFAILPAPKLVASDEALFARRDYLEENADTVIILLEEMLKVWRKINRNPSYILEVREKYNLLPHLSKRETDQIEEYYSEMSLIGSFPMNGGGANAVYADFAFYTFAGTIQGIPGELKIEEFWDLKPLNAALDRLGAVKLQ